MRHLLVTAVFLLLASPALAACEGVENGLGAYFDQDGYAQNCGEPSGESMFSLYFVLRQPTLPEIRGFEFAWRLSPSPAGLVFVGSVLPPCAESWDSHNLLVYLMCDPMPLGEATVLAEMHFILLEPLTETAFVQVGPPVGSSLPGHACIWRSDPPEIAAIGFCDDWDGLDIEIDAAGWTTPGIAAFAPSGGCESVAVEGATWSTIKTLYR